MNILVAGGAGFIGSNLAGALLGAGHRVVCVDDLSLGREENLARHRSNDRFKFIQLDLLDQSRLDALFAAERPECVFHLAANSNIQAGAGDRTIDLHRTFLTTFSLLQCMKNHGVGQIVFASSSAIYGERAGALREDAGPLFPISCYGAAKLASEAYLSAFAHGGAMRAWIIRFPNVVGAPATHGVIFDFINKLRANSRELEILGDGMQEKPYLFVCDLIAAMLFAWEHARETVNCFNVAGEGTTTVRRIAEIVVEEMELKDVAFKTTGGKRGWPGDVPKFEYDTSKIEALGWRASRNSEESVRAAVRAILGKGAV